MLFLLSVGKISAIPFKNVEPIQLFFSLIGRVNIVKVIKKVKKMLCWMLKNSGDSKDSWLYKLMEKRKLSENVQKKLPYVMGKYFC